MVFNKKKMQLRRVFLVYDLLQICIPERGYISFKLCCTMRDMCRERHTL